MTYISNAEDLTQTHKVCKETGEGGSIKIRLRKLAKDIKTTHALGTKGAPRQRESRKGHRQEKKTDEKRDIIKRNPIEIMALKNTVTKLDILQKWLSSRLKKAKGRSLAFEDKPLEVSESEEQKESYRGVNRN